MATAYAADDPSFALPLLMLAVLVAMSCVFLGVHYPSEVSVGQLLAS